MADITELILDDHETFRRRFAGLDELDDPTELAEAWDRLAALLEVHAAAEEEVFYPELIQRGQDPEDETRDAIGDHNEIRDAVREAAQHPVGSAAWWQAVRAARVANSNHMAEEEDDALPDFRRHAPPALRESLGQRFGEFEQQHAGTQGLDMRDKDPARYVRSVEVDMLSSLGDGSLGIGSLKGR